VSAGSVTFRDGTIDLGTVRLSHGKAKLVTSALPPGRDTIQVEYNAGPGMAPSAATVIETVPPRAESEVHSASEISRTAPRLFSRPADPAEAPEIQGRPDLLGTVIVDQGSSRTGSELTKRRQRAPYG
jgi:hypothetical protein